MNLSPDLRIGKDLFSSFEKQLQAKEADRKRGLGCASFPLCIAHPPRVLASLFLALKTMRVRYSVTGRGCIFHPVVFSTLSTFDPVFRPPVISNSFRAPLSATRAPRTSAVRPRTPAPRSLS